MITVSVEPGLVGRVIIDAPVGERVVGVSESGESWTVVPAAPQGRFIDPRAPLNQSIFYRAGGVVSEPVVRESRCRTAFTSLDGKIVVPFIMPHEWEDVTDPDVKLFHAGGRVWSMAGHSPKVGERTIEARVEAVHVKTMRELIASRAGVVFLYAPCPVPHCPVPDALTGVVTASPGSIAQRFDIGEMIFSVSFQEREFLRPVPARTWADVDAAHSSWADVAAANATWADVRDGA